MIQRHCRGKSLTHERNHQKQTLFNVAGYNNQCIFRIYVIFCFGICSVHEAVISSSVEFAVYTEHCLHNLEYFLPPVVAWRIPSGDLRSTV